MTKEEVDAYLKDKANSILKDVADAYDKDQLKEQQADATNKLKDQLKPAGEVILEAPSKEKFKSFGEFLIAARNVRINRTVDPRLSFMPGTVSKTTGHMEIGEDSQGGYSELMLA